MLFPYPYNNEDSNLMNRILQYHHAQIKAQYQEEQILEEWLDLVKLVH